MYGCVVFRYGYLTNTKVKFILVTTDLDVRDADVRNVSISVPRTNWITRNKDCIINLRIYHFYFVSLFTGGRQC